ncbi:sigma-54-dependent Fis family transcriptional regulator [Spirochaeta africana]|uniref:Transcriptional regulator containing GAF, AAA-type ATPase, and DNA binding domains n=1 Tax=Spirochaeta africana (strain ATCC 700263 / DSM 8902 / Z-7692) TaxID=889378 RepID=H9UJ80_SPIAZ|nr:sigma-54-dependent Fis family transcriptional regulator [Spirochaeta africana]AFG37573.1 transcriptional regulator containing GAF, AAA-type ATPase, and DNA binding domains [Spirochaeta africana DSM 8902]
MDFSSIDQGRFETFIEINQLINSDYSSSSALLNRIVESANRLADGEAASLLLVNPENNRLYFEVALGSKGPEVQRFSLNPGEGIAGWVAENNRSLIVNDVDEDPRFFSDISKQVGFVTKAILAVPMRIKNTCVGVVEIINKRDGSRFSQEDLYWVEIFSNQAALAIQNSRSMEQARSKIQQLQSRASQSEFHTLIAESRAMQERLSLVDKVAPTDSSVLILGESGVGKELIAEQIHLRSRRAGSPLIRVNCAALPEAILESELFGHVKGAFTDAHQERRGKFELADGGTIFLDEIGELPLNVQAKMLRVIQHKVFEKVGGSQSVYVDIRIIAATNRNLEEAVRHGSFRTDLYYRLNVLPIEIPALRDRKDDIPALALYFLDKFNRETKKQIAGFSSDAMETLLSYSWPGNVRELENTIERAVVLCRERDIGSQDLLLAASSSERSHEYPGHNLKDAVNLFKKHFIESTLRQCGWNQTQAARKLDIQRTYLSRLLKELDISR